MIEYHVRTLCSSLCTRLVLSTTFFSWQGQERQNHIESDLLWRVVLGVHSGFSFKGVKQWGLSEGPCGSERMGSFGDVLSDIVKVV